MWRVKIFSRAFSGKGQTILSHKGNSIHIDIKIPLLKLSTPKYVRGNASKQGCYCISWFLRAENSALPCPEKRNGFHWRVTPRLPSVRQLSSPTRLTSITHLLHNTSSPAKPYLLEATPIPWTNGWQHYVCQPAASGVSWWMGIFISLLCNYTDPLTYVYYHSVLAWVSQKGAITARMIMKSIILSSNMMDSILRRNIMEEFLYKSNHLEPIRVQIPLSHWKQMEWPVLSIFHSRLK